MTSFATPSKPGNISDELYLILLIILIILIDSDFGIVNLYKMPDPRLIDFNFSSNGILSSLKNSNISLIDLLICQ